MTRKTLLSLGICLTLILILGFSLEANPRDQITLNGKPLTLIGKRLQVGEIMPKVILSDTFL